MKSRCLDRLRFTWLAVVAVGVSSVTMPSLWAGEPWDAAEMDWPHWRGPEMNGISREKNLPTTWEPGGENIVWEREDLAGRSTPVVMDGLLYTIVRHKPGTKLEGEKVVCVDAATGKTKWESIFNVFLSDVPDTRVGWSSVIADPETNKVFALGVCGYFLCLDAKTGETLWSHSLSEEYGLLSTYGGRTNFPMTYKNLVIISAVVIGYGDMAKPAHRFVAFDQRNGQPVWFEGTALLPEDTTYSSPVLTAFDGEAAMVFASGDGGVHAFQPETGKNIWTYNVSARGINTTPVIAGNTVICGHSEENLDTTKMGALFAIDGTKKGNITKTGEIWRQAEWFVGKSSPIVVDGRVYGCEDTGTMIIADLETGKKIDEVRLGGPMRSSPIYADGKIYILTENGRWWVFKPTEDGVETVERARLRIGESYGSLIVSHGRIYIPTTYGLYCIASPDSEPEADPRPEPPTITPISDDDQPAIAAVVPVESVLRPGQKQEFQIRLYNERGQYLGLADENHPAKLTLTGAGKIGDDGQTYLAPAGNDVVAATVIAKIGDVEADARVRTFPKFPWKFTFDNGVIPEPWVGVRYRHIVIDYNLFRELNQADSQTAQLYLAVMTSFTNGNPKQAVYDDSTPRKTWSDFVAFLGIGESAGNVEAATKALGPALQTLKDKGVISSSKFERWEKEIGASKLAGVRLTVDRGPRKIEGNGVMVKISTIPKGQRSQGWIGPIEHANYTIEADVMGHAKDDKLPDIGIIAQRYTMDMMGASQQLQIRTWPPQLRMAKTINFAWKPKTWYTMKLQASVEGEKAVLRGKVWERDQEEPKEWLLEAIDESPNVIGSPGVFGNAKDSEVFYDRIEVYPNEG